MRAAWACLTFVATLAAWPASGQSVSEMAGKAFGDSNAVADQEVINASKAVEEAVKGYATNGESVRGATGAVSSLLIESDTLICAGWLISYERAMTRLATAGAFNSDSGTEVISRLQHLKRQIERVCDPILSGIGDTGGGGGGGGEGGGPPVRSDCPECDDEKEAYERAKWNFERAQFELERAHEQTNFVFEMWSRGARAAGNGIVSTPREAERAEEQKQQDMERARRIMDTAHNAWLDCVKACHALLREQFGFLERNKRNILIAAALGVGSTVAFVGGGSQPTTTVASTPVVPPPQTVTAAPPPPVQTAPTPPPQAAPAPPSPAGEWRCASCQSTNDPDQHERVLQVCRQLVATFLMSLQAQVLTIAHPSPWVTVNGTFTEGSSTFNGTGTGSVSGFNGVASRAQVVFNTSGGEIRSAQVTFTLGENGVFPGGRPVTYSVMLVK